jgi:hypothetical protein
MGMYKGVEVGREGGDRCGCLVLVLGGGGEGRVGATELFVHVVWGVNVRTVGPRPGVLSVFVGKVS